jgi:hypothetical protein
MRQNEANCCCGKWLRELWRIQRSCKTKPISRRDGRDGASGDRANDAKRTQFPPLVEEVGRGRPTLDQVEGRRHEEMRMQNKAKLGRTGASGGRCLGEPIVQNEANFSIADWGLRIGDGPAGGRLPCGLPPPACAGQSCKTKPISGALDTAGFHHSSIPLPARCAKQTQFPAVGARPFSRGFCGGR